MLSSFSELLATDRVFQTSYARALKNDELCTMGTMDFRVAEVRM